MKLISSGYGKLAAKGTELGESLVVLIPEKSLKTKNYLRLLPATAQDKLYRALDRLHEPVKAGAVLKAMGDAKTDPDYILAVIPSDVSAFSLLGFARSVLKEVIRPHTKSISLVFLEGKLEMLLADVFAAAVATRVFDMPEYGKRSEKKKIFQLEAVRVFASKNLDKPLQYGFATGEGANLVRYLGTLPPNILNTHTYGEKIKELAKQYKLSFKFYSNKELKKMGAGAFTAVDQGDPDSGGGIYEITYSPTKSKNKNPLVFVGKGLC